MRTWRTEYTWILLTGIILLMTIWWFPGAGSITTDTFSVAHGGKKAFYQTMQRLQPDIARSTDQLIPNPREGDRILILGPARYPTDEEWDQLHEDVAYGATVIFAASDVDPYVQIDQYDVSIVPLDEEEEDDKDTAASTSSTPTPTSGSKNGKTTPGGTSSSPGNTAPPNVMSFESEELIADTVLLDRKVHWKTNAKLKCDRSQWEVLVSVDGQPQVITRFIGAGQIVLSATDEIFSNESMTHPDQALLAYRIVEAAPTLGETWFDETLNSSGVPKVLGIIFDPVFRPVTLQLILIAVLFGWSGSLRYGPIAPAAAGRRRSIVEHAEALGILYYRSKAGSHAVECLFDYLKQQLRSLYGLTFKTENIQALARQAQMKEAEVSKIIKGVKAAERLHLNNSEASHLLKQLSRIISRIRKD